MSKQRHIESARPHVSRIVFLVILGFLVYLPVLSAGFLWDDFHLTIDNPAVRDPGSAARILTQPWGAGASDAFAGPQAGADFYRPVLLFSYMLDYRIWRERAPGYHLTNVLLHIAVGILAYLFILRLSRSQFVAFWSAAFFVAHPVSTEAVCYISGRSDPLSFLFILAGLLFYLRTMEAPRAGNYAGLLISYLLALGSRESSLIFLALVALVSFSVAKKPRAGAWVSLAFLTVVYLAWRALFLRTGPSVPIGGLGERLPGFFAAFTGYLKLLIWPFGLHMEYGQPLFSWSHPRVLSGLALFGLFFLAGWKLRRRDPLLSFLVFWFLLALLPFSGIYPLNAYMAEHWLYLPLLGFGVFLSRSAAMIRQKEGKFIAAGVLLLFYSVLTVRQAATWKDPESFYLRNLRYAGASARLLNNLGTVYLEQGRPAEAVPLFEKALAAEPGFVKAQANLGNAYTALEKYPQAIAAFEKAIADRPDYPAAYYNLGVVYQKAGREADAAAAYEKAVALNPRYAAAYNNLGNAYKSLGKGEQALEAYIKALLADPVFFDAANNLGVAYLSAGDTERALAYLEEARRIDPDAAAVYQNLAVCHYQRGETDLAKKNCEEALRRGLKVPGGFLRLLGLEEAAPGERVGR